MKKEINMMRRAALALLLGTFVLPAWAQDFPNKPLRIIVPQPPGGGFDTTARIQIGRAHV